MDNARPTEFGPCCEIDRYEPGTQAVVADAESNLRGATTRQERGFFYDISVKPSRVRCADDHES